MPKKTLIVSDVHQRCAVVDKIIAARIDEVDEVVFLGDWFDSHFTPPLVQSFDETCDYLKHLILDHPQRHKFVFLIGNHDLSYIYENIGSSRSHISKTLYYFCSGFTPTKAKKFRKHFFDCGLKDEFFFRYFKPVHRTQGFTLSHAGLNIRIFPYGYTLDRIVNETLPDVWLNFRNLSYAHNYLLSAAGICRGGSSPVGGIIWQDWNYEFATITELGKQIVGHTRLRGEPDCLELGTSVESWNFDTENRHYGIITDGIVTVYPVNPVTNTQQDS